MNLKSQRRLASKILKVGESRVWMDPEKTEDIEIAITRQDVRKLIHEGAISPKPKTGISRSRVRAYNAQRKRGRHRGSGKRTGKKTARISGKELWMGRIRSIRNKLKELRRRRIISSHTYRRLYLLAKGGTFENVPHMMRYIETQGMKRR